MANRGPLVAGIAGLESGAPSLPARRYASDVSNTNASPARDLEPAVAEVRTTLERILETQARIEDEQRRQAEEIRELARRLDRDGTVTSPADEDDESEGEKPRSWHDRVDEVPPGVDVFARWGDDDWITDYEILVETLFQGWLVRLLEERGMKVLRHFGGPILGRGESLELAAEVTSGIVAVRVREPLRPGCVRRFEELVRQLPERTALAKGQPCYAAVACLHDQDGAAKYAADRGMLVIRSKRKSLHVENAPDFRPRIFAGPGAASGGSSA